MEFEIWRLLLDGFAVGLAVVSMVYARWRTQTRATNRDIEGLRLENVALRERLTKTEARLEDTPTSKALHEVALSIEKVSGNLNATAERLNGLGQIVERLDRITTRQEDYLLNRGRRP